MRNQVTEETRPGNEKGTKAACIKEEKNHSQPHRCPLLHTRRDPLITRALEHWLSAPGARHIAPQIILAQDLGFKGKSSGVTLTPSSGLKSSKAGAAWLNSLVR